MISNPTQASDRWWDDVSFQDNLIALLVKDQKTLKSCGLLLSPEDFRPGKGVPLGRARWMVAERALEFYTKHHEPLGKLARADLLEYSEQLDLGASIKTELLDYVAFVEKLAIKAPDAVAEKVVKFKSRVLKTAAIEELVDLQASNQLTDEKWAEVCQRVTAPFHSNGNVTNYLETLSDRIDRRKSEMKRLKIPYTFIEPLDVLVRTVGPKQLGMVLAPYKRGKSMFLLWMAVAYARQRLNTLYITLEDPKDTVEDRMDSLVSHIPMKNLVSRPVTLRNRFERFRNMIHSQIRIYDGTEGGTSLQVIENAFLSYRDEGFIPDAILD